jgi:hypothetical protein
MKTSRSYGLTLSHCFLWRSVVSSVRRWPWRLVLVTRFYSTLKVLGCSGTSLGVQSFIAHWRYWGVLEPLLECRVWVIGPVILTVMMAGDTSRCNIRCVMNLPRWRCFDSVLKHIELVALLCCWGLGFCHLHTNLYSSDIIGLFSQNVFFKFPLLSFMIACNVGCYLNSHTGKHLWRHWTLGLSIFCFLCVTLPF